jgi:adenylate cyclase
MGSRREVDNRSLFQAGLPENDFYTSFWRRPTVNANQDDAIEQLWRNYLTTGEFPKERRQRRLFRLLPGSPRCKNCYAPFEGSGSIIVQLLYGKRPSNLNPQLCNVCEVFAKKYQGGAEIELSLLFADVRGSTTMAENMAPKEFHELINKFYRTATHVLVHSDALIDKIIGDQVAGMYVPGFAGPDHAQQAISAAQEIMRATKHGNSNGPWIPLGAGVHTGTAFVGSVGSNQGTTDITVLGDAANIAARLSSLAEVGQILISEPAYVSSQMTRSKLEKRSLDLKGKSESVSVYVLEEF